MNESLFPLSESWPLYATFCGLVCFLLAIDLGIFHRKAHEVSFKEALTWSIIWIGVALLFNVGLYFYTFHHFSTHPRFTALPDFSPALAARDTALKFLTGYIVEKSLAVDNLFVFVVLFRTFSIPLKYQHRILFFGILGALLFRGIFIGIGSFLIDLYWVNVFFGLFLIVTGIKIFFSSGDDAPDPENNRLLRWLRGKIPLTLEAPEGRFFLREQGKLIFTPLFLALLCVEISDIVFAFDSVPAIFAITPEPFIVFTSNVFAILGLRAMFFMLAQVIKRFHLLKFGLGFVLAFVGLKMIWLNPWYGGEFPVLISLFIIVISVGGSIVASLLIPPKEEV